MKIVLSWLLNTLALFITAKLIPGITVDGFETLLIAALVIGLINATIKPLIQLLSLPVTIFTLGTFALVINAAMFGLAAWLVPGFKITGFWSALFGSIVLSVVATILHMIFIEKSHYSRTSR
jgi:putative membrane protein